MLTNILYRYIIQHSIVMTDTTFINHIPEIVSAQKTFFASQQTKDISYRKKHLQLLKTELINREKDILNALYTDFRKSEYEGVMTETSIVLSELKNTIKKLHSWSKPKTVTPALLNFPSSAKIYKEPFGAVLIIAPWNYPYQLALGPLIGAIAAGNTVVLKPSELTPNTSKVIQEIINSVFPSNYVTIIQGGVPTSQKLLAQRWDYIFFTGSVFVGKIVAKAAAEFLTPITLELGGKSPCIIDQTANLKLTAKRLVWGKFLNGGQTCIAPDYILIHQKVKTAFITFFKQEVYNAYGTNPETSEDLPRIINHKNWHRLKAMLDNEDILVGGQTNEKQLYIAPTLIGEPSLQSEVMKDEIFGPILPLISYNEEEEIETIINTYDKPLSFYIFTNRNSFAKQLISKFSFGGGVINDTLVHFVNHRLPFGGVGESGIGKYHGRASFDTFTHSKGIVKRYNWLDLTIRYAPYTGKLKKLRTLLKLS